MTEFSGDEAEDDVSTSDDECEEPGAQNQRAGPTRDRDTAADQDTVGMFRKARKDLRDALRNGGNLVSMLEFVAHHFDEKLKNKFTSFARRQTNTVVTNFCLVTGGRAERRF